MRYDEPIGILGAVITSSVALHNAFKQKGLKSHFGLYFSKKEWMWFIFGVALGIVSIVVM